MAPQKKVLRGFLDGIQDAKLQNFTESEGTLKKSCAASYRLDYQGVGQVQLDRRSRLLDFLPFSFSFLLSLSYWISYSSLEFLSLFLFFLASLANYA